MPSGTVRFKPSSARTSGAPFGWYVLTRSLASINGMSASVLRACDIQAFPLGEPRSQEVCEPSTQARYSSETVPVM